MVLKLYLIFTCWCSIFIFDIFLELKLWVCMTYLVLDNILLGDNCLCFCRKFFLYLIWFFIEDTGHVLLDQIFQIGGATTANFDNIPIKDLAAGLVLLDQIFHIGGATIANFDNIPIKDLTEFVMLFSVLFDKL